MAGLVENVEESSKVALGPAIVVALHNADSLGEWERRSEQETGSHFEETSVNMNDRKYRRILAMHQKREKEAMSVCFLSL
jgi:hypothetical protein